MVAGVGEIDVGQRIQNFSYARRINLRNLYIMVTVVTMHYRLIKLLKEYILGVLLIKKLSKCGNAYVPYLTLVILQCTHT
jgi:hypothetical protein